MKENAALSPSETSVRNKYVYSFGGGFADGNAAMRNLLGGKGANLAEMSRIGIPVPPGFTITTEVSTLYTKLGREHTLGLITPEVHEALGDCGKIMGTQYGSTDKPLLMSVRSGARVSMPGMMDTVLNLGLNDELVEVVAKAWDNERFAWDSYRRLIQMYGSVVMGLKPSGKTETDPFEKAIDEVKEIRGIKNDTDLSADELKTLVGKFKALILERTGKAFPQDVWEQLNSAILAVFESWNTERAKVYREIHNIPDEWGTAVNVQAMVYGNLNGNSATGVAFTRDAATGENLFNGEFLFNSQGEDVVAGIRTPRQITLEGSRRWSALAGIPEEKRRAEMASLEELMPEVFGELMEYQQKLEEHYSDMQDLEFTIQDGRLWILQTRNGKRTSGAMVKMVVDMVEEGMIDEEEALHRVDPERLNDLLHPIFRTKAMDAAELITRGLPASPGAATGRVVFSTEDVEAWKDEGEDVILVRQETSADDLRGMHLANGILTARGGMTSHAAVVARGMGKCCVAGAESLQIDYEDKQVVVEGRVLNEGDWISINGSTGEVYEGKLETEHPKLSEEFRELLLIAQRNSRMYVRANADTPEDARVAKKFNAQGIGLCRTEHMFFNDDRITSMREMILAHDDVERQTAINKLLPMQRSDFEGIFQEMDGHAVTIRLLDPPLHEFLPKEKEVQQELAEHMGITLDELLDKIEMLHENNPMMGHRGCRLGITFPAITEMQARAIFEAAIHVKRDGIDVRPEVMVPLIGRMREFAYEEEIIRKVAEQVFDEFGERVDYKVGSMIEIPRAALTADVIAQRAEFFSFGTNDLTQMTFGFSRDDIGKFLPTYIREGIFDENPFEVIDENGVGRLVKFAVRRGRETRKDLKLGICGEHGGNPQSVDFFHRAGLDYVSCSPYRVPIAWVSAAKATLKD